MTIQGECDFMVTDDYSVEKILYIVPAVKNSKEKYGSCYVLYQGNDQPVEQFNTLDTTLKNLIDKQVYKTGKKEQIRYIYPSDKPNGSRGKTYFLPNGQILVSVPILPVKKGRDGYISLVDVNGMYSDDQGNGVLTFKDTKATLNVLQQDKSLHDKICKAKSLFCAGYTPADFLCVFKEEREKLQNRLVQPGTDKVDILQLDHSLAYKVLEFLDHLPSNEKERAIREWVRMFGRFDMCKEKNSLAMDRLAASCVQVLSRGPVTREDEQKIVQLAQAPIQTTPIEEVKHEEPPIIVEAPKKYWSAASSIKREETEEEENRRIDAMLGITVDEMTAGISRYAKSIVTECERSEMAQRAKPIRDPITQLQQEHQKQWKHLLSQLPATTDWKLILKPYYHSLEMDQKIHESVARETKFSPAENRLAAIEKQALDDPVMRYTKQLFMEQEKMKKKIHSLFTMGQSFIKK